MNAIEKYFHDTGDSPAALAQRIGRSPSTITRAMKGQRNPSFDLARDVERGTQGQLTAAEFMAACLELEKGSEAAA